LAIRDNSILSFEPTCRGSVTAKTRHKKRGSGGCGHENPAGEYRITAIDANTRERVGRDGQPNNGAVQVEHDILRRSHHAPGQLPAPWPLDSDVGPQLGANVQGPAFIAREGDRSRSPRQADGDRSLFDTG